MGRSNTANGGTTYADLDIEVVSTSSTDYTLRAVIYLTSLSVSDNVNSLAVSGSWSRSGSYNLNGSYNHTEVWSQVTTFPRGGGQTVSVSMAWSGVEYWGTTLNASASYSIPAGGASPPGQPTIAVAWLEATKAGIYTSGQPADNGASVDTVKYRVYRASDGLFIADINGGYGGVTFEGLSPATLYNAYAQAHNSAGWGAWGPELKFTTYASVPNAPAVGVTDITSTSARPYISGVPGDNGSPIQYYRWRLHRLSDGALMGDVTGPQSGVTYTNLAPVTDYEVYGFATNAYGQGPPSWPARFKTLPGVPGPPIITSITSITPTTAVVSWSPPVDNGGETITAYDVQYSLDPTFATGTITQGTGSLTGLTPGATYSVRVRAKNASGPGPWSNVATFTTTMGIKVYTGTAWVDAPVYAWSGTAWVACEVRIYNGTAWVPTG